ncbi:MAG TPA: hypothetical protein VHC23_13225 [Jatrophihabitans sp.]|jgi:hypothetical protein|nr:hypothetical protein [Jatrophihabitans sp.]
MTASVPAASAANGGAEPVQEFDLVESTAGWQLTITLTERLREALASGGDDQQLRFGVRVAPNLVPGVPFEARLAIREPEAH